MVGQQNGQIPESAGPSGVFSGLDNCVAANHSRFIKGANRAMHRNYSDIMELIEQSPVWFDENAVPRYCQFSPDKLANIYADEAALVEVECRGCKRKFRVAHSELNQNDQLWGKTGRDRIAFISDLILERRLKYGDPPNVQCCAAGPTMTSVSVRVLEYWCKPYVKSVKPGGRILDYALTQWVRQQEFEVDL